MDSLTQFVLGGSVAAAVVPAAHRRRAAIAGAILGTLPDLDGIPLALTGADVVTTVTWHRGPSHSLPVLLLFGWLVWLVLRRSWLPVREVPRPWLAAILLALLTHPLLDAFTVYGTQLLWPLPMQPVMWSSVFIIDPAYTLPLLVAFVAIMWLGPRAPGRSFLAAGMVLSSAYLGWSLAAKARVDHDAAQVLSARGLADAPRFSVPTPLNTLLWRVVVMTPDGILEGYRSLAVDRRPMLFQHHPSDTAALKEIEANAPVRRLLWFTSGFMKAQQLGDGLVLTDLRMGAEPDYIFRYMVARRQGAGWAPIPPQNAGGSRNARAQLAATWQRIWNEPPTVSATSSPGTAP